MPVIAAVHGVAVGGGFQLALGADLRYVAPDTRLGIIESKWGLVPDMAGTQLMLKQGYEPRMAAGVVAISGTLAMLIPPSVALVIYGLLAEVNIGALLIGGVIPGILVTITIMPHSRGLAPSKLCSLSTACAVSVATTTMRVDPCSIPKAASNASR